MKNNYRLPKGPSEHKFFQTLKIICKPLVFLERCKNRYGNIFTLRFLGLPSTFVISSPENLKQVFSETSDKLFAGEANASFMEPILGASSSFTMDGSKHLRHRKLLLPCFHRLRVEMYGELMYKFTKEKILSWKAGDVVVIANEMREITFNIILSAIFGMDKTSARFVELTKLLHILTDTFSKPYSLLTLFLPALHRNLGPLTPWRKIMKLRHAMDVCLFEEIEARRKESLESRIDILSLLLQVKDDAGNFMTTQEIRDEMITLLLAGHETTTIGISWAMYGILSNSEVYKKIKDEFNNCISCESELLLNLDKFVYLDAVIKEGLRVTPVVPYVVRTVKEEYELDGFILPKGTRILPCIYLAHRDPAVWSEPDKFIPERFLDSSVLPYSYLPFSNGIRRCIGASFAHFEMKIIIAQILLNAELQLKPGYKLKLDNKGIVISPSGGVPVVVVKIE